MSSSAMICANCARAPSIQRSSAAAQARRRLGALTLGHLPPPLRAAALPAGMARLERLLTIRFDPDPQARIAAIDAPWLALDDLEGLENEVARVGAMGFAAKALVHPRHVAVVHRVLRPGPAEVARAEAAEAAFAATSEAGSHSPLASS